MSGNTLTKLKPEIVDEAWKSGGHNKIYRLAPKTLLISCVGSHLIHVHKTRSIKTTICCFSADMIWTFSC